MTNSITVRSVQTIAQQAAMTQHWPALVDQITQAAQQGASSYTYRFGTGIAHLTDLLTLLKNSGFKYTIVKRFGFFGLPTGLKITWK